MNSLERLLRPLRRELLRSPQHTLHPKLPRMLPLPFGRGWGEGLLGVVYPAVLAVIAELAGALLRLKADTEVQSRYDELAGKNTEGVLNAEERAELESLVRANSILSLLKAEAHAFLQQPKAA